ncbi:pyruvate, water dikinase regulatory protein [Steroidobacter sp.]|uniref:posphoenolpyruvate synthetase regulatory kinase/phosphorylase PpsR n=1 Tax=Steroidobacter sp. TaxID=1978227 RepID=UPI001A4043AE|nr:pyruvate, water dikinase regulatory protein [Steroidobacter sp.]MBL8265533.1 kinase/pyrophosphorylase [Steroidobacter sp.]
MERRTVFFVSDQTGVTAETMGHSLLTQFDGQAFRQVTLPFISTVDKAQEAVRRINATGEAEGVRPVIFSTLVQEDMREIIKRANGLFLDFFDAFLGPLEMELKLKSSRAQGKAHGMQDIGAYTTRINATNFALANDDGAVTRDYERADLILVGVSRTGKTPTCLYLALQYGVSAANYPFADEELETGRLPAALTRHQRKLYGLTIAPERLQQIRHERRPNSNYSSPSQVDFEVRTAESIFRRYDIPYINTTECSIEEIASRILDRTGVERRLRP